MNCHRCVTIRLRVVLFPSKCASGGWLEAEFPSGCFAWGCGVLEDKSLCIDQASALPLVPIVPWFVDQV